MNARKCDDVHKTLIAGRCPWCGHVIIHGKVQAERGAPDARELLHTYERAIPPQPPLEDPWFSIVLARVAVGDEAAVRAIVSRCLRMALRVVQEWAADHPRVDIIDALLTANNVLLQTVRRCVGMTSKEFLSFVRQEIEYDLSLHFGTGRSENAPS